ncbi:hypothetical protein TrCOL_g11672 [Triparma columacea]|uniref:PH domain-containing protein n=1 Tax=Triparma columacea TaxID=722753 RepID=A0A9W7L9H5_9STRA|nr:hypothetical protein TrCOL_g11672 [Triparma columacea]
MGSEISQCVEDMTGAIGEVDITDQANREDGEVAAGQLWQRPSRSKLVGVTSSSRTRGLKGAWYVLRGWPDCTLTAFKDNHSETPIGVIHLLKCDIKAKQQEDDKFHFQIHHSSHGSKHLFADSSHSMHRWIQEISNVIEEATSMGGMEGYLKKRGGMRLHTWQSRWFTLMGPELCWFEKATDSFPRGAITLSNHVRAQPCKKDVGGEKYVFEIIDEGRHDSKKRREFACETTLDRQYWVEAIQTSIQSNRTRSMSKRPTTLSGSSRQDEMVDQADGNDEENKRSSPSLGFGEGIQNFLTNKLGRSESSLDDGMHFPDTMEGYMEKHNSYMIWQKRYFECANGEFRYWKSKTTKEAGKHESSKIYLGDILKGSPTTNPMDQTGILIATDERIYSLRCTSREECQAWIKSLHDWQAFLDLK